MKVEAMKVRHLNLSRTTVALLLIIGLLSTSFAYVVAQSATTFTISSGVYGGAPSYTLWRESSNYYAKDAYGVQPSYSGSTNASTVLLNVATTIDGEGGGSVFLRSGTYENVDVDLSDLKLFLYGEGTSTILQNAGNVITFNNTAILDAEQGVSDLTIDGVDDSGIGLYLKYLYRSHFYNLYIKNCDIGLYIHGSISNTFTALYIRYNNVGVQVRGFGGVAGSNANVFVGGEWTDNDRELLVWGDANSNKFFGVVFEGLNSVEVELRSDTWIPHGTVFYGNYFEMVNSTAQTMINWTLVSPQTIFAPATIIEANSFGSTYDYNVTNARGDRTRVIYNKFGGISNATIRVQGNDIVVIGNTRQRPWDTDINIVNTGSRNVFENNEGFNTEAEGTAEASNDDWVTFGLDNPYALGFAGNPQTVVLTVQESDARYIAQVKTVNTTHFQLYLYDETAGALETVDKTISWIAKYQP